MLVLGAVVIRVPDLDRQIAFWTQALDLRVREPHDADFALLMPRHRRGPNLSLDARPSPRTLPPRLHLDLYAEDQSAEVERLVSLGARRVRGHRRPAEADYNILEDPEDNRFCVIDAAGRIPPHGR